MNSETIEVALKSEKPDLKGLVGTEGNYGEQIGLTKDWAARIVNHVGNYAEVFERNVGVGSKFGSRVLCGQRAAFNTHLRSGKC